MDLQNLDSTNKVDRKWFGSRIRLSAKAIYREFGLQGFCDFWTFMMTEVFSLTEHNLRNDYMTPGRCVFCACPVQRKATSSYCDECDAMIEKVLDNVLDD